MYTHCLFCTAHLGRNASVEPFPVGRRLAFDAAKGRLWVVCRRCERWNLTPLEERWEAIEACERLFRDTRLRVSTDNIGMAKLREGLELVRIGAPKRPEFAAWRYGDQFGRRRRKNVLIAGAGITAAGVVAVGELVLTAGVGGIAAGLYSLTQMAVKGNPDAVVARVRGSRGVAAVRRKDLEAVRIRPTTLEGGWLLHLAHEEGFTHVTGDAARRALGDLLPHVNRYGGSREQVARAVERLESVETPEAFVQRALVVRAHGGEGREGFPLLDFAARDLLAFEMALHEESERRAMEGELAALEARWKEAEEVAAIADDLLLPGSVGAQLARLKRRLTGA